MVKEVVTNQGRAVRHMLAVVVTSQDNGFRHTVEALVASTAWVVR
jgi:hypothetical protein